MIDIFLSRPSWIGQDFAHGLNGFLRQMELLNLNPRTIGVTDYPNQSPLDEVINLMGKCSGAVILGYPQIQITSGFLKEESIADLLLPTEWNHIEAGLAYAQGLPLLVIHHTGVRRGIFDHGALNKFIYEENLANPSWPLSDPISGALKVWKENVMAGSLVEPPDRDQNQGASKAPSCPNCSTTSKRIYMSPIAPEFIRLEGATHECPKCKFKGNY